MSSLSVLAMASKVGPPGRQIGDGVELGRGRVGLGLGRRPRRVAGVERGGGRGVAIGRVQDVHHVDLGQGGVVGAGGLVGRGGQLQLVRAHLLDVAGQGVRRDLGGDLVAQHLALEGGPVGVDGGVLGEGAHERAVRHGRSDVGHLGDPVVAVLAQDHVRIAGLGQGEDGLQDVRIVGRVVARDVAVVLRPRVVCAVRRGHVVDVLARLQIGQGLLAVGQRGGLLRIGGQARDDVDGGLEGQHGGPALLELTGILLQLGVDVGVADRDAEGGGGLGQEGVVDEALEGGVGQRVAALLQRADLLLLGLGVELAGGHRFPQARLALREAEGQHVQPIEPLVARDGLAAHGGDGQEVRVVVGQGDGSAQDHAGRGR